MKKKLYAVDSSWLWRSGIYKDHPGYHSFSHQFPTPLLLAIIQWKLHLILKILKLKYARHFFSRIYLQGHIENFSGVGKNFRVNIWRLLRPAPPERGSLPPTMKKWQLGFFMNVINKICDIKFAQGGGLLSFNERGIREVWNPLTNTPWLRHSLFVVCLFFPFNSAFCLYC